MFPWSYSSVAIEDNATAIANKGGDVKCSDVEWTDVINVKWFCFEVKWNEVQWSELKWSSGGQNYHVH